MGFRKPMTPLSERSSLGSVIADDEGCRVASERDAEVLLRPAGILTSDRTIRMLVPWANIDAMQISGPSALGVRWLAIATLAAISPSALVREPFVVVRVRRYRGGAVEVRLGHPDGAYRYWELDALEALLEILQEQKYLRHLGSGAKAARLLTAAKGAATPMPMLTHARVRRAVSTLQQHGVLDRD
jgi:hypothetical protein